MQIAAPITPNYSATIFNRWHVPDLSAEWLRVRKRLFVDELGWRLETSGDFETDQFDTDVAVHSVAQVSGRVIGGLRAIRTTSPYLAKTVFPELAGLRGYPSRADIWEVSRLGLLRGDTSRTSRHLLHALMMRFAISRDASSLIGVIDLAHARAMRACGFTLRSFTPPQVVGFCVEGKPITAFCAELRLAEQAGPHVARVMQIAASLEIEDYAIRELDRVSA